MNTEKDNLKEKAIPREVAKRKFRNWIEYATEKLNFSPQEVPKAIFIPITDINNLAKALKIHGKIEVSGIRIYFMRDESYKTQPEGLYLKCFVVPTVQGPSGKPTDQVDTIITIPSLNKSVGAALARIPNGGGGGGGGDETIYDFTSPCPPDCGGTTPW